MKSKRAKKLFDARTKLLNSDTSEIYDYYVSAEVVSEIVILAEQDAEERALKAFKKFLERNSTTAYPHEKCQLKAVEEFREIINNIGQYDE